MSIKDEKEHELEIEIIKTKIIQALPETVFKALTEPKKITQWFQDEAIFEPRVGGKIRLVTLKEIHPEWKLDRDYTMDGIIRKFIPNKTLSYTWKFNDTPDFSETTIIWELEPLNSNKTSVKLTHEGFTGKEKGNFSVDSHEQGWTEALEKLAKYCKSLPDTTKD